MHVLLTLLLLVVMVLVLVLAGVVMLMVVDIGVIVVVGVDENDAAQFGGFCDAELVWLFVIDEQVIGTLSGRRRSALLIPVALRCELRRHHVVE